jgi:hypothetical protein
MNGIAAAAFVLLLVGVLALMHFRRRRQIRAERGAYLHPCLDLFETYRVEQDDVDFPMLEGRYRGHLVRLVPIVDHVAVRKLPSLWLLATVKDAVPVAGVTSFLARPLNTEFFSPAIHLPDRLATPPGFPDWVQVRTDRPEEPPPAEAVEAQASLFRDPKMKELVIAPPSVRLVYQAAEGRRAHYMVLRQPDFGEALVVDPVLVRTLLDRAIAIIEDLKRTAGPHERARDAAP